MKPDPFDDLAAAIRRSDLAASSGKLAADRAEEESRAWRERVATSWRASAAAVERARGVTRLTVETADGGVKTFTRPAGALFPLVRLLEHDHQVLDLQWSRA